MINITIYHNPNCSTSRSVLAMIKERGIEPTVIEYLNTPPTREQLQTLIAASGRSVRGVMRSNGDVYESLDLANQKWTDGQLLDFMMLHPILINRPLVITPLGTRLCRPKELLFEILPSNA